MPVAVVTGAASGIGRALASQLAGRGYVVHLADVRPTKELADSLGGVPAQVDVSKPDEVDRLAESAADAEIVCLNAGIVGEALGAPWEVPPEEWHRLLGVNLLGVVNGLRAFVPRMLESGRPGRIVITASLAGLVTFPGGGAYAATKHAVVAVAEQAAMMLAETPLSVTLLCPALVRSGMSDVGDDPEEVAATALDAAESGRFLVLPQEWAPTVVARADQLRSGEVPGTPAPEGSRS